jgi:hypothetical protein
MLYLSIILGITNIFMKNVSFAQSSRPEYSIDLNEEYEAEDEAEDKHETKEDNNMST